MSKVCILNYGSGNVKSVYNLFSSIIDNVKISNDIKEIKNASHLILPGVGAFGAAMHNIKKYIPLEALENEVLQKKKPFLGVCVGMQVMASNSLEFGDNLGLNWIPGTVCKLSTASLPLPHIGWNNLSFLKKSEILDGVNEELDFYFVHSFKYELDNKNFLLATTEYGENFPSIINKENLYGVQFHPEKSQIAGKKIAINFLKIK
jgi:glutamine amidotransferase